jgi:hypothetical protein
MLTKLKLALLIAAPLVAGTTTYAVADSQNGDSTLDGAERAQRKAAFEAKRAARQKEVLATYDTNHDGTLDDAERKAMRDARLAERFQAMDKNGDGKLSLDELKAGAGAKRSFHRHGRHRHARTHGAGMKP